MRGVQCIEEGCENEQLKQRRRCSPCTNRRFALEHGIRIKENDRVVDEIDVQVALGRDTPTPGLGSASRRVVSRVLTEQGVATRVIAYRLCVAPRTITRYRKADRIAAAEQAC